MGLDCQAGVSRVLLEHATEHVALFKLVHLPFAVSIHGTGHSRTETESDKQAVGYL